MYMYHSSKYLVKLIPKFLMHSFVSEILNGNGIQPPPAQNMPPKLFLQFILISGFRHLLQTVILPQKSFLFVRCVVSIKKLSYLQDTVESSELSEQNDKKVPLKVFLLFSRTTKAGSFFQFHNATIPMFKHMFLLQEKVKICKIYNAFLIFIANV